MVMRTERAWSKDVQIGWPSAGAQRRSVEEPKAKLIAKKKSKMQ